jgi:hypothetical protein
MFANLKTSFTKLIVISLDSCYDARYNIIIHRCQLLWCLPYDSSDQMHSRALFFDIGTGCKEWEDVILQKIVDKHMGSHRNIL